MIEVVEKYGRKRKCKKLVCEQCNEEFWKPVPLIRDQKHHFCSKQCADTFKKSFRTIHICANCGKEFLLNAHRTNKKNATVYRFCSRGCKDNAQRLDGSCPEIRPSHYKSGECVYRKRAFEYYLHKCAYCGYNEIVDILQVHHLDRNRLNGCITNLMILCPTCHAIPTKGLGEFKWEGKKCVLVMKEKEK
jgi:5-methylcytosine-specific restriction endonuclease McrA